MNLESTTEKWLITRAAAVLPSAVPPLLAPGSFAGRYRVVALIGRGGNSEVYRVHDGSLNRDLALKLSIGADPSVAARFLVEARALAALDSPGIVKVHDFGEAAGHPFYTMELLRPVPEILSPREAQRIVLGVCSGLAALHAAGYVHRDIKRANILLRCSHQKASSSFFLRHSIFNIQYSLPVLIDLGASKCVLPTSPDPHNPSAPLSFDGTRVFVVGTPGSAAPEQLDGRPVTPATDVYGLGVLVRELFDGHVPFGWHGLVRRATASLPEDRYPSVAAFRRAALLRFLAFPWSFVCRRATVARSGYEGGR